MGKHWSRGFADLMAHAQALDYHQSGRIACPLSFRCLVSCDSVPRRSWPLFKARDILQSLIHDFSFHGAEETE